MAAPWRESSSMGRTLLWRSCRPGSRGQYTRYSDDPQLARAEGVAKLAGIGPWSLPNPAPPWELRQRPDTATESGSDEDIVYHGNRSSKVLAGRQATNRAGNHLSIGVCDRSSPLGDAIPWRFLGIFCVSDPTESRWLPWWHWTAPA